MDMRPETTMVFVGPSLSREVAASILPAVYARPARRGDFYALIATSIDTVLLIDGVFHNEPSVWQREILAAMRSGVTVYGASSMGALRAAELAPWGMRGHGTVFDWYHTGKIDGDDEVALIHGDESARFRALSEPMVNIRYTLERAASAGVLTTEELGLAIQLTKDTFYPERSYGTLLAGVRAHPRLQRRAAQLAEYVHAHRIDLKQADAVSLLRHVSEVRAGTTAVPRVEPAAGVRPRSHHQGVLLESWWDREAVKHRRLGDATGDLLVRGETPVAPRGPAVAALGAHVALRWFALRWGELYGLTAPASFRDEVEAQWRAAHDAHDLRAWLVEHRVTVAEFEDQIDAVALARWLAVEMPGELGAEWHAEAQLRTVATAFELVDGCLVDGGFDADRARGHLARYFEEGFEEAEWLLPWRHIAYCWMQLHQVRCPDGYVEGRREELPGRWSEAALERIGLSEATYDEQLRRFLAPAWVVEMTPVHFGFRRQDPGTALFSELHVRGRLRGLVARGDREHGGAGQARD